MIKFWTLSWRGGIPKPKTVTTSVNYKPRVELTFCAWQASDWTNNSSVRKWLLPVVPRSRSVWSLCDLPHVYLLNQELFLFLIVFLPHNTLYIVPCTLWVLSELSRVLHILIRNYVKWQLVDGSNPSKFLSLRYTTAVGEAAATNMITKHWRVKRKHYRHTDPSTHMCVKVNCTLLIKIGGN